jgi:hypothetical protein
MTIGEGQSAGCPPLYGGPHYGFFAAKQDFTRRMPGRIVGETVDADDRRAFVLTLQTREQHIRREKATSNITTNQTLLALAGLVTLSWLGPEGLREVGETCAALAAYARERIPLEPAFAGGSVKGSRSARRSRRARSSPAPASTACIPATRSGATIPGSTTSCSLRSPRSARPPTSTGSPRCWRR